MTRINNKSNNGDRDASGTDSRNGGGKNIEGVNKTCNHD